jgi:pimeloyl-ACP methyl ester carboxylesterase
VRVQSTVPAMAGQTAQLYVRERVRASMAARTTAFGDKVVLMVHGAGTPAEVAYDVPFQDYSWMRYLADGGLDVFSMDTTGYGRSTRPLAMNDPCNMAPASQTGLVPKAPCAPSYPRQMTTIASDWNDIDAVVDYLRALRHVDKVSLVGWSLGGPRTGGYIAQHPEKVQRLVALAPAYNRGGSANQPAEVPALGAAFNLQTRADFLANWDRQLGCPNQYDPAARDAVWSDMLASDPVGATWGAGGRRAPQVTSWGWGPTMAAKIQVPALLAAGVHDVQVTPARVRELYADIGSKEKVLLDLGCSSHNALWERTHLALFSASLEWLTLGTVDAKKEGIVKRGYEGTPAMR